MNDINGSEFSSIHKKDESNPMSYERVRKSAEYILSRSSIRPEFGIICGTGLGKIADAVEDAEIIRYDDIPYFPNTTVLSHKSRLVIGSLGGVGVMVMQGRFHFYEGHSIKMCSMPVRVMHLCGVTSLISTNASGALSENLKVGDFMIQTDHVNLLGIKGGHNPLRGEMDGRFGSNFVSMNRCYDLEYIKAAKNVVARLGYESFIQYGVYAMTGGPSYETPAELRMLKILGIDSIGMSTVHENIVARQCKMRVFSLSLITNVCVLSVHSEEDANHEEVIEVGKLREKNLITFFSEFFGEIRKMNEIAGRE